MKNRIKKYAVVLMLAVLVSCVPVGAGTEPALPSPTVSETPDQATPTLTQTETATSTELPTDTPTLTLTLTAKPSATQSLILLPSATVQPTRARRKKTPTLEPTLTETPDPTATFCPKPTPEPLWVDPVTSPTDQFSQIITVRIGNGEEVTIITESGTFTVTGNFNAYARPALVEVTLLPNTVHHLEVQARVRKILMNGCIYGGYTRTARHDRYGAPLTIVQGTPVPYP